MTLSRCPHCAAALELWDGLADPPPIPMRVPSSIIDDDGHHVDECPACGNEVDVEALLGNPPMPLRPPRPRLSPEQAEIARELRDIEARFNSPGPLGPLRRPPGVQRMSASQQLEHSELCAWRFGATAKCDCGLTPEGARFVVPREYGPEERYRIYALRGGALNELATCPDPASIGATIVRLHEDAKEAGRKLSDQGVLGILDGDEHEWIVLPWQRGS